ncbi:hypothetical protein QBC35DRAFT_470729 [Podospora australis]|uniref:Uncharacterized protein n=1 Tax=Podospora australis TaxID=1536484 RepID=A0AAN7AMM5_9PEZI|nr:hypothetical protein QBC35DRAFT_470729 [Podospora australis]
MNDPYTRRRAPPMDPASNAAYSHSRTRTTSSNTFPVQFQQPPVPPNNYYAQMHLTQPQVQGHQRRSPSVNTFSTVSSGGMAPPAAYRTSPTTDIRRSTSSRSGGGPGSPQPSGYVALLRKQKATVWCDRAQQEDPRLLAQQRMAKMRAHAEVLGGGNNTNLTPGYSSGRTSTGLSSAGGKVAAKIRHHGKPTVVGYSPGTNYNGVGGVPLRLSATEVEGEESEEDDLTLAQRLNHRRTGSSSRSSTTSGRKTAGYRSSGGLGTANTQGGGTRWSPQDTPERSGSLVLDAQGEQALAGAVQASGKARSFGSGSGSGSSTGSGSSAERMDDVPDLQVNPGSLANNSLKNATVTREKSLRTADELKRRGSVDERTMTLTTGRLFIANPD